MGPTDSENRRNNAEWWSRGLRFECAGCGRCCRGEPGAVFFTPEEGRRVGKSLGVEEGDFLKTYVTSKWGRPSFVERRNGDCIFYDAEKARCAIYPLRPAQCAFFPFWYSVTKSAAVWRWHAKQCPGMDRGRLYTALEIREFLRQNPFEDL
jgi:Fe-S-cluster containining protein